MHAFIRSVFPMRVAKALTRIMQWQFAGISGTLTFGSAIDLQRHMLSQQAAMQL